MEGKYGNSIFDIWCGITAGRIMYLRPLWLACADPWDDTLVLDLSHGEKHRNYRITGAQ